MDFKAPLSIDITIKKHPDLIESVALLAESRFSKVEILGVDFRFGHFFY